MNEPTRREWLGGVTAGAVLTATAAAEIRADPPAREPFRFMLNTATIQGQKLPIVEEIELAARTGYQAIEPWARELDQYVKDGGSLKDLGKRVRDNGLTVEDCIAFAEWIVDDETRRKKGLEECRRIMDMLQQIGGKRMAAPPAGATNDPNLPLLTVAERYRALYDLGEKFGVVPIVEFWGFSKTLSRLGEAMLVAIESDRSQACVLVDIFHLYKGDSGFKGLALIGPSALPVIHMNDYPAAPPRRDHRPVPRLPRRRRRPLEGGVPRSARERLPRLPVAGAVQPRILEKRRPTGGSNGTGEDEGGRPRGPGGEALNSQRLRRVPPNILGAGGNGRRPRPEPDFHPGGR